MRKRVFIFCLSAVIIAAFGSRVVRRVLWNAQRAVAFRLNFNLADHTRYEAAYEALPPTQCRVLFLGDSLTAFTHWKEWFPSENLLERGIPGDMTQGIVERLPEVCRHRPNVIVLECGINNLSREDTPLQVVSSIQDIVTIIHRRLPQSKIVLESLYPINNRVALETNTRLRDDMNTLVLQVNTSLKTMTGVQYVDVHSRLLDETRKLDRRYTVDGLHLTADGYKIVVKTIAPFVE